MVQDILGVALKYFCLDGSSQNSLKKLNISIHNWTSKRYVPLDILNMCRFCFGLPGNDCTEVEKSADEVNLHILSISNGTFFFGCPFMNFRISCQIAIKRPGFHWRQVCNIRVFTLATWRFIICVLASI